MNILIEGGNLNPIKEGTRNIAMAYAKKFAGMGHRVLILTKQIYPIQRVKRERYKEKERINGLEFYRWFNYSDKLYGWVEKGGIVFRTLYNSIRILNYINFYLTCRKIKENADIDVVHIFIKGLRPRLHYKMLKLLFNKPVVLTLLGDPSFNYIKYNPKKTFKNVDTVLVTSKTIYNYLKNLGVSNAKYLPYGIDTKEHIPIKKHKRMAKKRILCLRYSAHSQKDNKELLKALNKLASEMNFEVLFNKNLKSLEQEIRNSLEKEAVFIDKYENISDLLGKADLLIDLHPKDKYVRSASPPLLILEAMSCGVKVISTDIPEIREIIKDGENGFLVKENNEKYIYKKLKEALNTKKKIGKKARETIIKKFDIEKSIKDYEKVYRKIE